MNRFDFQRLAKLRIKEAGVLLEKNCYEGAYYLAGYAVECALKACIAKQTQRYEFPDKKRIDDSYTHDLTRLVKVAGLEEPLQVQIAANIFFRENWVTAKKWSEEARYRTVTADEAMKLYSALLDHDNGVLPWLQKFW